MRKEKKMNRVDLKGRTFRIKGQLIPHTDFMIAPKTLEKEKTCGGDDGGGVGWQMAGGEDRGV